MSSIAVDLLLAFVVNTLAFGRQLRYNLKTTVDSIKVLD